MLNRGLSVNVFGKTYAVVVEKYEDGWYVAEVPALEACATQAKTLDELIKRTREVIELCLEEKDVL